MMTTDTYQLTNLPRLMRAHKITIRQLAAHMDITMKRVREVRNGARVSAGSAIDFNEAVFDIVKARALPVQTTGEERAQDRLVAYDAKGGL